VKRDYYEVLGVGRTATLDDIKKSYRRLARQYHPDVNKDHDAEERFKEIGEAYSVLSDPDKKAVYDQFGHDGLNGQSGGFADFTGFDIGDIFDQFFGGGARPKRDAERGNDLRFDISITLEEAATGLERPVSIPRSKPCPECEATGAKPGTSFDTCSVCRGTGQIRRAQQTILGSFSSVSPCVNCRGTGRILKDPCVSCRGEGRVHTDEPVVIRIPVGVEDGTRLQIRGAGEAGTRGGPPGDLYVFITVEPHEIFERRGRELHLEVPITFAQAALGATKTIPGLDGPKELSINAGTQNGQVIRIREAGMPGLHGRGKGDLHAHIRVITPTKLTDRQKDLLREFAKDDPNLDEDKGLLGRIKDAIFGD
jgi:molecular chaperone DnaJ